MKDATLITAKEHLEEVCVDLAKCDRLAFDTESNGFYAYKEKVCLIQISSPTEDFIVDPIAFKDISCLGPLFADPKIEILFHAGEYDVLCLKRDYGFTFTNLYDTMIAARILGTKELGLAAAIERHFGIVISKKLQRADWGKRPLTHEMIRYAQGDTHFLMRLADIQKKLLEEKGRMADAKEAFADLAELEPNVKTFDQEGFWKLVGREDIGGQAMAALKEIWLFREHQASSRDRAPFRVMPEDLMVKIAQAMPETREALAAVRGMTPYILERFGSGLLSAVEKGKASPPVTRPPSAPAERKRLSDLEWRTFEALRAWRKSRSEKDAVEPVVIMTTESLRTLAIHACRDHGGDPLGPLSDLKRSRYGEDILKVVATARAAKNGS
ncbi:MAG: HRDC domain-containing protein [Elusimicrobiota bacterium]|nr:MAG: HRDC domain-containing protein [Elusimicrobiota bacterium]